MKPRLLLLLLVAALPLAAPASASSADRSSKTRVLSALGAKVVKGKTAYVDVLVVVGPGKSAREAKRAALRGQGADPVESSGFAFNGLFWDVLPVTQNYNPSGAPLDALGALQSTHSTWSGVSGSRYRTVYGGQTTRCPSLVSQCRGPQTWDGKNDVGWARLGGTTLGVTWYGTSRDEADMVLSTRYGWSSTCGNVSGRYDVQTVLLHENGHVAGLDHSSDRNAVMYASYHGAQCSLAADDRAGISGLYPN